jgi:hypothetical protein
MRRGKWWVGSVCVYIGICIIYMEVKRQEERNRSDQIRSNQIETDPGKMNYTRHAAPGIKHTNSNATQMQI